MQKMKELEPSKSFAEPLLGDKYSDIVGGASLGGFLKNKLNEMNAEPSNDEPYLPWKRSSMSHNMQP